MSSSMVDNKISGRLALITGASGGYGTSSLILTFNTLTWHLSNQKVLFRIGAACARDLFSQGVNLALTYSTNRTSIEELVASLKSTESEANKNLRVSVHKVDLASVEEIENLFAEIKEQHQTHVDILISNAGYGKRIVDISSASFLPP